MKLKSVNKYCMAAVKNAVKILSKSTNKAKYIWSTFSNDKM